MLDEVRALLILQDRDRRLLALAKDLEKLPQDEARAKAKLAGDEAAVIKAHNAFLAVELKVKKVELDIETRKNDEYQAFNHEIARYEKDIDTLETQELEAMEEVDKHRAAHLAAKAALDHTQQLIREDLASIAERQERMRAEHQAVTADRAKLAAQVPGNALPVYERLMRTKSGLAVAPMTEGRCGGCHMKLIASTAIKAQSAQDLTQCENCGRILYVAD
jgi:hypothetical protein